MGGPSHEVILGQPTSTTRTATIITSGVLGAVAFTAVIALTAGRLADLELTGRTALNWYPWRLVESSASAQVSAWAGYLLHNGFVWGVIWLARRSRPAYDAGLRWFNWALVVGNAVFIGLHIAQTQRYYDGLARDVHEATAVGSVALMLILVLILEAPRRGLAFGRMRLDRRLVRVLREYHGYLFSWAIVYTFWYHPTVATPGHLAGFFYMFLLFWQSALLFNRTHRNRWWTLTLEVIVIPHSVFLAVTQPEVQWQMFGFGFGAVFIITQMHGLGLSVQARRIIGAVYVLALVVSYGWLATLRSIPEILRIPVFYIVVIGLVYPLLRLSARRTNAAITSDEAEEAATPR